MPGARVEQPSLILDESDEESSDESGETCKGTVEKSGVGPLERDGAARDAPVVLPEAEAGRYMGSAPNPGMRSYARGRGGRGVGPPRTPKEDWLSDRLPHPPSGRAVLARVQT